MPYERFLMRCKSCRRQWSVGPDDDKHCACGGELVYFDLNAEIDKLPYSPFDPSKK